MPNIPTHGTAGGISFNGLDSGSEAAEAGLVGMGDPSDRPNVTVGEQDHGDPSPAHGAAGGYEINPPSGAPHPVAPGKTRMKDAWFN